MKKIHWTAYIGSGLTFPFMLTVISFKAMVDDWLLTVRYKGCSDCLQEDTLGYPTWGYLAILTVIVCIGVWLAFNAYRRIGIMKNPAFTFTTKTRTNIRGLSTYWYKTPNGVRQGTFPFILMRKRKYAIVYNKGDSYHSWFVRFMGASYDRQTKTWYSDVFSVIIRVVALLFVLYTLTL